MLGTPQGKRFPATIAQISDEEITLDLNHPLAGKALNFKVKLLEISEGHGDNCGCDEMCQTAMMGNAPKMIVVMMMTTISPTNPLRKMKNQSMNKLVG